MNYDFQNLTQTTQGIHNEAVNQLETDKTNFLSALKEWGNGPNPYYKDYFPSLLQFVEKYLEWHITSPETRVWKHQMFSGIIPQSNWGVGNIFGPLLHFLGYHVYDDGSFSVKWVKHTYETDFKEHDSKVYESPTKKYLGTKDASEDDYKDAFPILIDDFDGTQNPQVILDAMLKHEANQKRKQNEWEALCMERLYN